MNTEPILGVEQIPNR